MSKVNNNKSCKNDTKELNTNKNKIVKYNGNAPK